MPLRDRGTWITTDADSLYHMRRLARLLDEGGAPAGTDPLLNAPHGSAIPWPPYYVLVTRALAGFAPADEAARHDWIERRIASLPRLFGVLTSLLAALAAMRLAGPAAGLLAGSVHALSLGSIVVSRVGNGDHHAWIALLAGGMLWATAEAFRGTGSDPSGRRAAGLGVVAGALAGVALGSWVASLLHVIPIQLALGWLLFRNGRRSVPGLAAFGIAFHVVALVTLLPAVLSSPWNVTHPWIVVNLSWFHAAFLLLGALVFVPLPFVGGSAGRRAYPWVVAGGLALIAFVLLGLGVGPGAGIREGFAWMQREDEFMGAVWESRGLLGEGAAFDPLEVLGFGLLLLPFAWIAAARLAFGRGRFELLPWAVAVPLLAVQAARQARFADALVLPAAVVLGWGAVALARSERVRRSARSLLRLPAPAIGAMIVLLVGLAHAESVRRTFQGLPRSPDEPGQPEQPGALVVREMTDWLRTSAPAGAGSVLASWTWGHSIEWGAGRSSVATNFGTFVGEDSFRDPSRFFLAEEPEEATAIAEERRSRFVMLTSYLPNQLRHMIRSAAPERAARWIEPGPELRLRHGWYRTLGARLLHDGREVQADGTPGPSLARYRLAYASPRLERRIRNEPTPIGMIWELVPGAIVSARGAPGDTLEIVARMRYPRARYELDWVGFGVAGADGLARVRIPYSTEGAVGEIAPAGPARWRFAGSNGEIMIPESAVQGGEVVAIPAGDE